MQDRTGQGQIQTRLHECRRYFVGIGGKEPGGGGFFGGVIIRSLIRWDGNKRLRRKKKTTPKKKSKKTRKTKTTRQKNKDPSRKSKKRINDKFVTKRRSKKPDTNFRTSSPGTSWQNLGMSSPVSNARRTSLQFARFSPLRASPQQIVSPVNSKQLQILQNSPHIATKTWCYTLYALARSKRVCHEL